MGDKKEKKHSSKEHKKEKRKKKDKKDKLKENERKNVEKKPTSDQILESLFNDVKNAAEPIDLTTLISKEKNEEFKLTSEEPKHSNGFKKKSSKKKKKSKSKDRSESLNDEKQVKRSKFCLSHKKTEKRREERSRSRSHKIDTKKSRSHSRRRDSVNSYDSRGRRSLSQNGRRSSSRETDAEYERAIRRNGSSKKRSASRSRNRSRSLSYLSASESKRAPKRFRHSPGRYTKHSKPIFRRFPRFNRYIKHHFTERDYVDKYGKINKEKLLEIATKNATKLAMEGKLPKGVELVNTMKNKTITELVSICKQLHEEEEDLMEKVSSDDEDRYDRWHRSKRNREDDEFVPKPVRHSSEIKINISNANSLPTKTPQQRMAHEGSLRLTFPVSSGAQHRSTMEWVPNTPAVNEGICPLTAALSKIKTNIPAAYKPPPQPPSDLLSFTAKPSSTIIAPPPIPPKIEMIEEKTNFKSSLFFSAFSSSKTTSFPISLPPPPAPPVLTSFDSPSSASVAALVEAVKKRAAEVSAQPSMISLPPPPPLPPTEEQMMWASNMTSSYHHGLNNGASTSNSVYHSNYHVSSFYMNERQGDSNNYVFPVGLTKPSKSVQELVAERLTCSARLKENPNDFSARNCINKIDRELSIWAQSGSEPGKFFGSTGARVLSAEELGPKNPKYQAWIKKDIFKKAPEVNGGVGMKLLQKMGWQPGEGLGKDGAGALVPLSLDVKSDRKGLQSIEDRRVSKRESVVDPTGKNPVSIVMEYCSKGKFPHPEFTCLEVVEGGMKRFLWKAVLNGIEYQASLPSTNKKAAKSQVCLVILEALGLNGSAA